ncbi:hypothetical protein FJQ98_00375 [Lysinibacillus agricola]|uniref:Uncharacterized protein n=1 Tax=Lysinibacillus agricola TaxID=2590012 RepID=A0ABX7AS69_9BACI|nr:hypothetical protein [Lysinibacillus agricola]QQP12629.1 hypothetical protein FJQ98_00375 [Lysinibacillus agricola]
MKKLIRMETGRLLGAHRTPPGSSALRESEASAAMFYLRESEASAAMFYLRESEASAAKRPVGTEINLTL